jgi:hypothetical protein
MATVKEVIAKLSEFDPELEVITAKDDEGNGYNTVCADWIGILVYDGDDAFDEADLDDDIEVDTSGYRKVVVI